MPRLKVAKCAPEQVKKCVDEGKFCNVDTNRCVEAKTAKKKITADPTLQLDEKHGVVGSKAAVQSVVASLTTKRSSASPQKKKAPSPPRSSNSPSEQVKAILKKKPSPKVVQGVEESKKVNYDGKSVDQLKVLCKERKLALSKGGKALKKQELIDELKKYDRVTCDKSCKPTELCDVDTGKCTEAPAGDNLFKLTHDGQDYYGSQQTLNDFAKMMSIRNPEIIAYTAKKSSPPKKPAPVPPKKRSPPKKPLPAPPVQPQAVVSVTQKVKPPLPPKKAKPVQEPTAQKVVETALEEAASQPAAVVIEQAVQEARASVSEADIEASLAELIQGAVAPAPQSPSPAPVIISKGKEEESPVVVAQEIARVTSEKPLTQEQQEIVAKIRKCIGI